MNIKDDKQGDSSPNSPAVQDDSVFCVHPPPSLFSAIPLYPLQASNWLFIGPISLPLNPLSPYPHISLPHFFLFTLSFEISLTFPKHSHFPLSSLCSEPFVANPFSGKYLHITLCVTTFLSQQSILKLDLKCTFLSQIVNRYGKICQNYIFLPNMTTYMCIYIIGIKK